MLEQIEQFSQAELAALDRLEAQADIEDIIDGNQADEEMQEIIDAANEISPLYAAGVKHALRTGYQLGVERAKRGYIRAEEMWNETLFNLNITSILVRTPERTAEIDITT